MHTRTHTHILHSCKRHTAWHREATALLLSTNGSLGKARPGTHMTHNQMAAWQEPTDTRTRSGQVHPDHQIQGHTIMFNVSPSTCPFCLGSVRIALVAVECGCKFTREFSQLIVLSLICIFPVGDVGIFWCLFF